MVGLLGTCAGILDAFRRSSFPYGPADYLVPFALGLGVGLPAFWAHRHLNRYADEFGVEMARISEQVVNCLSVNSRQP